MSDTQSGDERARADGRRRSWVPLTATMPVLLILMFLLPSALNLPQTPPQQTLEFAPVPPTDEDPPPPENGNVSSLGLGSSSTTPAANVPTGGAGTPPPLGPPPPPPPGTGTRPVTKRCVGSPPRQTEDPSSPPCVGFFDGDNGGATAAGVTKNEIVVLVYLEAVIISAGLECSNDGCDRDTFYDLGKPETESPHDERDAYWPHVWRVWQRYFNERYQTYGRNVHLIVQFGSIDTTPEARIADVAKAAAEYNPFAVVADVDINGEVYASEWARRGKTVFMTKTQKISEVGFQQQFFNQYPGQIWDYNPSVQELAENYSSFLCAQIVGHPVSFSGDGSNGKPRRLGILKPSLSDYQNRIKYADIVQARLEACGADIATVQTYDSPYDGNGDTTATVLRNAGVTTLIDMTDTFFAVTFTQSIGRQVPPWRPELLWQMDNVVSINTYEDPTVMQNARNMTVWPKAATGLERACEPAYREIEPTESNFATAWTVCYSYNAAKMLFTGIQVAGPKLTNASIDKGLHAIPEIPSGDPRLPACFYRTKDFTCVKDAQAQWWDPAGTTDRTSQPGCWRSIDGGHRYLPGSWPDVDLESTRRPLSDACNIQGAYA